MVRPTPKPVFYDDNAWIALNFIQVALLQLHGVLPGDPMSNIVRARGVLALLVSAKTLETVVSAGKSVAIPAMPALLRRPDFWHCGSSKLSATTVGCHSRIMRN